MIFPDNFEEKSGFAKIRALVRASTLCGLGARHVDEMTFSTDGDALLREFNLLDEMLHVLEDSKHPMPVDGFCDLSEALARIRLAGTWLQVGELHDLRRSLGAILALVRYFAVAEGPSAPPYPLLSLLARDHETLASLLSPLLAAIDRTLNEQGEIRDSASPELLRIRREMDSTLSGIGRLLRGILRQAQSEGYVEADVSPTLRDGRLVIPVAPAYRRKLHGIAHDESATGKTLYIEPAEVVEANNRIRELEAEEQQEIIRILTELTAQVRPLLPDLLAAYDFLGRIDFLRAKARLAGEIEGCVPAIAAVGDPVETDWVQARHPLLYIRYRAEGKRVVPLDIALHAGQRIVLISGPNAGGKSVCLETLGLVQYMFQCGLPVPMRHNSTCTVYDDILMDIGDQQSIDNDLSTYSSHLTNMKRFLRHASPRSLLLIDEMGSGTEPQIGGAIAQAVLGGLNSREARGVITTHFNNLKLYADETPGIVNGAMLYDQTNMRPLFMLEVGRPGSSFAIEIAHRIGLPADIIEEAKHIVGSDYVNVDKYLHDIQRDRRYWQLKRDRIHQQERELEELRTRLDERLDKIQAQRQDTLEEARREASRLLSEANAQIERTIREIKEAQAEREATRSIRRGFNDFVERVNTPVPPPKPRRAKGSVRRGAQQADAPAAAPSFAPGDHVRIKGQTTVGEVLSTNGSQCLVAFGMIKSTLDTVRLEKVKAPAGGKNTGETFIQQAMQSAVHDNSVSDRMHDRRLRFRAELDIRGMRAEEALSAVAYYIDDAIMLSVPQVRILHGTGTGALRQAVRQYLATLPGISSYHDEHVQFGGTGITVVEIE